MEYFTVSENYENNNNILYLRESLSPSVFKNPANKIFADRHRVGIVFEIDENLLHFALQSLTDKIADVISISYKNTQLMEYLFGEGGIYEITEDELRNKYSEGYERFRYIALSKVDETGATLSTDELITKKNLVDEAYQKALDGEDFGALIAQYSEDYLEITDELTDDEKTFYEASNKQASEDGLVIDKNGIFNYEYYAYYNYFIDSNIVNAVFSMNIGDVKVIELANAFWVIQKCDKNEKEDYFESKRSLIYNEIATPIIDELYTEWENELLITFNESAVNKYDPRKLDPLFITENTAK